MSKLVVISKSQIGLSHDLDKHWVTIGRAPGNRFQLPESSISGQHCEALWNGKELLVRDMRSTNGTFIEGKVITEGVLRAGEVLRLGDVELRLESSNETLAAPSLCGSARESEANVATSSLVPSHTTVGYRKHQVLLVDDSMAFLETAGDVFEAFAERKWEVHKACGADQALSIIQKRQIELAVLDINMPILDGLQLLVMLHRRYPQVKKVILTAHANERHRADSLAAGAELFLEKPTSRDGLRFVFNVLNDSITWKQREGFSGTLQEVSLTDIIQIECLRLNSCILEIHAPELQGEIYIESGTIVHAATDGVSGEQALHRLLSLNNGQFHLCPYQQPLRRTVQGAWECLLMESARLRDEERSARTQDKTSFISRKKAATAESDNPNSD
jgi:CheY-like chemotaxis protein